MNLRCQQNQSLRRRPKRVIKPGMALDIRAIHRDGLLEDLVGHWRDIVVSGFRVSVTVEVSQGGVLLTVPGQFEQYAQLEYTECALGGQRPWFLCPSCDRRVAILYAPDGDFECRACCGLGYATQREGPSDRATTKADRIRERLGWQKGLFNPRGDRPKGMHLATYERLLSRYRLALQESLNGLEAQFGWNNRWSRQLGKDRDT